MFTRGRRGRLEAVAIGWGGLVGAAGLIVAAALDDGGRLVAVAIAFALGGFLAGVRAQRARALHAVLAVFAGHVLYAVWAVLAAAADLVADAPSRPALIPEEIWPVGLAVSVGAALAGAAAAARLLRPSTRRLGN